jgi:cysteinyl-tRNA synthetase
MRLYDTATRAKVAFEPLEAGKVGIYVCGPTVYDYCHVGHARCYVAFDVIVRYLRQLGLAVTYVRNVTDIDDKIIRRAQEQGEEPLALAARFTDAFHDDMRRLGNRVPDVEPTVSGHLPEIIALVERLVASDHAYVVDGDVYFAVDRFADYGALAARQLDELQAGARVEVDPRKRSPLDFALWKAAKPLEPSWPSPWGAGRPGWHIECSAMSERYLGATFDLHGGGMDLAFPHHENERAQSRASGGATSFARYWLHNGFINVRTAEQGEEKMSKSLGNFFTIREVCARHEPEALRLFLLGTHYRNPIAFEIDARPEGPAFPLLEEAERRLSYAYRTVQRVRSARSSAAGAALSGAAPMGPALAGRGPAVLPPADAFRERFAAAMDDDFNTAAALGLLAELLAQANKLLDQAKGQPRDVVARTLAAIDAGLETVSAVLGLLGDDPQAFLQRRRDKLCQARDIDAAQVAAQIAARGAARRAKDFKQADALRAELSALGVELMDRPDGTTDWVVREEPVSATP